MPYLILVIGLIVTVIGLYRFLMKADTREIKTLFLAAAATGVGVAALFLTITGRLPIALATLTALWPIGAFYLRTRKPAELPTSRKEAFDILGLPETAGEQDIKEAYLRLMKKVHPDQKGSDWLAQKINAARNLLLDK